MTRSNRRLPAVAVALGALVAGLLGACSAGRFAQTAEIVSAVPGAQGEIPVAGPTQSIFLRNVTLDYPGTSGYAQGGSAPLSVWIVNGTEETVTLTTAASGGDHVLVSPGQNSAGPCSVPRSLPPVAPSVPADSAGATKVTPSSTGHSSPSPSSSGPSSSASTSSASTSPASTSPASPSPAGSSSSAAGSAAIHVAIPAGGCVRLDRQSAQYLQIAGLSHKVDNGGTVPVTFTFSTEDHGSLSTTLDVPVNVPASANPRHS